MLVCITNEVKDTMIRMYLKACIFKHAMKFFEWRQLHGPLKNRNLVKEVITARNEFIK